MLHGQGGARRRGEHPHGDTQLAEPTLLMTECEQGGWLPSDAFALGRPETLPFVNIVMDAQTGDPIVGAGSAAR